MCGYIVTCCRGTSVVRSLKLLALPPPFLEKRIEQHHTIYELQLRDITLCNQQIIYRIIKYCYYQLYSLYIIVRQYCLSIRQGAGKPSMSYKKVNRRGRYGNEVGNSLCNKRRTDGGERGCKPKGAYKEILRPSRRLGLVIIKSSLILPFFLLGLVSSPCFNRQIGRASCRERV